MKIKSRLLQSANLLLSGAVSGPKQCIVMLQDAIKKPWPNVPTPSPSPPPPPPSESAELNEDKKVAKQAEA